MIKQNKVVLTILLLTMVVHSTVGQNLPEAYSFSYDGTRLIKGQTVRDEVYNDTKIERIELEFSQPNWKSLLSQNYTSHTDIPATLKYKGKSYPNVGVRYKGQTSYQRVTGDKKSFNITLDYLDKEQSIDGYETFNLNNSYEDNSFMREAFYENIARKHVPSPKVTFVHLYINGLDYGLYPSVQALDGQFIKQWFLNNNGTRWRAERVGGTTPGQGGGGGGGFGAGTSTLNYLGTDTSLYKPHYTLKHTEISYPWADLVRAVNALGNTTSVDSLNKVIDVDGALWFLAKEILFGDDDSYVNKGGMDYYVYYDKATERLIPLEYDANSIMTGNTSSWDLFLKSSDTRYPLCNKLFNIPELRQRYLAHVRTMVKDLFDPQVYQTHLDTYFRLIDTLVQADPIKLMTYSQFTTSLTGLKNWMQARKNFAMNNAEFNQPAPLIFNVSYSSNKEIFKAPSSKDQVWVQASISISAQKAKACYLYHGTGYDGRFTKSLMYDDGLHEDGQANDGVYGAAIAPHAAGEYVRFYVEAIADNRNNTAAYYPEGAEHDVFIYRVNLETAQNTNIVINEVVSSNTKTAKDQDGEYDDWIELYNKSSVDIDISRWILSDNQDNLDKYRIPNNTILKANSYLIIWADEDGKQTGYHANFKLSASGEALYLLDSSGKQVDFIQIPSLNTDEAYARQPNGTGSFIKKTPSFNKNNDGITSIKDNVLTKLMVMPNPASSYISLASTRSLSNRVTIFNLMGQVVLTQLSAHNTIDVHHLPRGSYILSHDGQFVKFVLN